MFAGRYMWWVLLSTALFLFFSVYFPWVSTVIVAGSGCDLNVSGCGGIRSLLEGGIRPAGYFLSGGLLLVATGIRIRYARLNLVWLAFYIVWFCASGTFLTNAGNMWMLSGGIGPLLAAVPFELPFLAAFTLFLCFPLEDYEGPGKAWLAGVQLLVALVACWTCALTLVGADGLSNWAYAVSGSTLLMQAVFTVQQGLATILLATGAAAVHPATLFMLFLVFIGLQAILRTRPVPVGG